MCDLEMTPNKPEEKPDLSDDFILTPSVPDERPDGADLTLEAESVAKAEEITFNGEEELEVRIEEAMAAYDKAMDEAADIEY